MTTKKQELMLFGGWAKAQRVTVTDDGVLKNSVVVSPSISRLELQVPLPPTFAPQRLPIFGGCVQAQRLALTQIEIADEDHKLPIEIQDSPYVWERAYQAIGKKLWRKLEKFYRRTIFASQPELWLDEEEANQEEVIRYRSKFLLFFIRQIRYVCFGSRDLSFGGGFERFTGLDGIHLILTLR